MAINLSDSAPPYAPASAQRDRFLDLLRGLSVVRVVALHLFTRPPVVYLPWIQWLYPGMPEIFFVSGSLIGPALARRRASSVVRARLRRVIPPYLPYAVAIMAVMVITDLRTTNISGKFTARQALWFVFPFNRPEGSTTRVILWGHLWFITAFLWLIVLSPVLWWLAKRIGVWLMLVPLAVFALCVYAEKRTTIPVSEEFWIVSQFGTFFVLGMVRSAGRLPDLRPRTWAVLSAMFIAIGVLVAFVIEPVAHKPIREMYSSRSAYLFVGAAWLCAALAAHGPLSRWANRHRLTFLQACTQRTFTMYLWGPAADAVSVTVAKRLLPHKWAAISVHIVLSFTALTVAVLALGWIEDLAANRAPRLLPGVSKWPRTRGGAARVFNRAGMGT